jgi:hypothetical protein
VTPSLSHYAWRDAAWRAAAEAWIRATLAGLGAAVTGEITQPHLRAWSTVMRVPTDAGTMWFKACGPGSRYEPALMAAIERWAPGQAVAPVAIDVERAWSLSPDAGMTLRSVLAEDRDLSHWERVLPQYGQLQYDLTAHAQEMLALGVPDLRPERMPAHVEPLLDDPAAMMRGEEAGLTDDQHARLHALLPEYTAWCAELASAGIGASLNHDDLHDNNVAVGADGGYRFYDWGDASVAHPFTSLLVALRSLAYRFELKPDSAELHRVRDAYLEPWTTGHDRAALSRAAALAAKVAMVGRSLSWQRALLLADPAERAEYADAVPGWLAELLAPDLS